MVEKNLGKENVVDLAPEIPNDIEKVKIMVITHRHDKYDNQRPINRNEITDSELAYGHLTAEGKEHASQIARQRVRKIIKGCKDVSKLVFAINASNTVWVDGVQDKGDGAKVALGQRAIETAEQIRNIIMLELQLTGMTEEEAESHLINNWINTETGKPVLRGKEPNVTYEQGLYNGTAFGVEPKGIRQDKNLQESRVFNQAPGYIQMLVEKNGGRGEGFWEDLHDDTLGEERLAENPDSEGPEEIAERIDFTERAEIRLAEKILKKAPDIQIVFFNVSHGESIEPHTTRSVGAEKGTFNAGFSDGYSTAIYEDGRKVTRFPNGTEIER